jgi:hypothetical protein
MEKPSKSGERILKETIITGVIIFFVLITLLYAGSFLQYFAIPK